MAKKRKKLKKKKKLKIQKKLTPAEKRAKKEAKAERQKKYMWVFMNGKQVKIKRPPTIDGMSVEEFIKNNADELWYHQNEMWEEIPFELSPQKSIDNDNDIETDKDVPF